MKNLFLAAFAFALCAQASAAAFDATNSNQANLKGALGFSLRNNPECFPAFNECLSDSELEHFALDVYSSATKAGINGAENMPELIVVKDSFPFCIGAGVQPLLNRYKSITAYKVSWCNLDMTMEEIKGKIE
jgi:hypothetical protein